MVDVENMIFLRRKKVLIEEIHKMISGVLVLKAKVLGEKISERDLIKTHNGKEGLIYKIREIPSRMEKKEAKKGEVVVLEVVGLSKEDFREGEVYEVS